MDLIKFKTTGSVRNADTIIRLGPFRPLNPLRKEISQTLMKALIVDDSRTMRRLLSAYLSEFTSDIVEAEDGLDALEKLRNTAPVDVALVDWDMPRMNGLELVKSVRSNPVHSKMKILMVTSHNSMEDVGAGLEAGAGDFLMKPMTEDMLKDKLRFLGLIP